MKTANQIPLALFQSSADSFDKYLLVTFLWMYPLQSHRGELLAYSVETLSQKKKKISSSSSQVSQFSPGSMQICSGKGNKKASINFFPLRLTWYCISICKFKELGSNRARFITEYPGPTAFLRLPQVIRLLDTGKQQMKTRTAKKWRYTWAWHTGELK
jgi:hypothetical protein